MNELDLDINNYNLNELLKLFNISYDFTLNELKKSKKIVLNTHPDKSKLDSKYFIFFKNAYSKILNIWNFRHKCINNNVNNTEYVIDEEKNKIVENFLLNKTDTKTFNKWFNQQFNEHCIQPTTKGYDSWLKSDDGLTNNIQCTNASQINNSFEKLHNQSSNQCVVHRDYYGLNYNSSNAIDSTEQFDNNLGSDIFSNLQFDDVKHAYTNSLIQNVSNNKIQEKMQYNNNVQKYESERNNTISISEKQTMIYLKQKEELINKQSMIRAYNIENNNKKTEQINSKILSSIALLK